MSVFRCGAGEEMAIKPLAQAAVTTQRADPVLSGGSNRSSLVRDLLGKSPLDCRAGRASRGNQPPYIGDSDRVIRLVRNFSPTYEMRAEQRLVRRIRAGYARSASRGRGERSVNPPETRYAKSGDIDIAYQVVGDGPLDLVLDLFRTST